MRERNGFLVHSVILCNDNFIHSLKRAINLDPTFRMFTYLVIGVSQLHFYELGLAA